MDEAPIEVTYRIVEEHGVAVLIISFQGTYGFGSLGNGDAGRMERAVKAIAEENPLPDVAVLDGTALDYEWGDMIDQVAVPLSGRAWVWAISERCAEGLTSYVDAEQGLSPSESLFEPLAAAVAEVIRRRRAGRFVLHDPKGRVAEEYTWTERGYQQLQYDPDGEVLESLWSHRRMVERIARDSAGAVRWHAMWPVPDEAGGLTEACRLGARIVVEQGRIRTLDFSPSQSRRALRPDWVDVVGTLPELQELCFYEAPATDEDVERALDRLPHLSRLDLRGSRITDRTLARIAEGAGPSLTWVGVSGCQVSKEAGQALKAARPKLRLLG